MCCAAFTFIGKMLRIKIPIVTLTWFLEDMERHNCLFHVKIIKSAIWCVHVQPPYILNLSREPGGGCWASRTGDPPCRRSAVSYNRNSLKLKFSFCLGIFLFLEHFLSIIRTYNFENVCLYKQEEKIHINQSVILFQFD